MRSKVVHDRWAPACDRATPIGEGEVQALNACPWAQVATDLARQVIDDQHVIAPIHQRSDEVVADEPGAPSDDRARLELWLGACGSTADGRGWRHDRPPEGEENLAGSTNCPAYNAQL